MNGDELVDVGFEALLTRHRETGAAATVSVARPASPFGVVELDDDDVVSGFSEGGRIPYWVNCGVYVLSQEAIERFPDRGDHESTAFPELAAEGRLRAFRHEGLWLTVNTPKELRRAQEHVAAHPEWLGRRIGACRRGPSSPPLPRQSIASRSSRAPWTSRGGRS